MIRVLFLLFLFASCSLSPVKSEFNEQSQRVNKENIKDGHSRVIFYNSYDFLNNVDTSSSELNLYINEKGLVHLKPLKYYVIDLKKGEHNLKLVHKDIFDISSNHKLKLKKDIHYFEVKMSPLNPFSNDFEEHDKLPKFFHQFYKDIHGKDPYKDK